MGFCPVCGGADAELHPRCERVGRYYGYTSSQLAQLAAEKKSVAVPFFEVNRMLFALEHLARHPMASRMVEAVEQRACSAAAREFGNLVRVLPFFEPSFPEWLELFIKEDVSKTMVVYQYEDGIEHLGSEERAVAFAEIADRFFHLGEHVPPTALGLSRAGTKFVVTAGFSRERFVSLRDRPRDLSHLWKEGTIARLALLDFVLGQNDRNSENVLVDDGAGIGLIDNDDSFVGHERLVGRFAYLEGLDGDLRLDTARDWFTFRLPDLLALLSPLALPETTMTALCRRFAFAKGSLAAGLSLRDFCKAVFVERPPLAWHLPNVPWTVYRPLVRETAHGTSYRTLIGVCQDDGYAITILEGNLLSTEVRAMEVSVEASLASAEATIASLTATCLDDGYVHVLRRRLFANDSDLRIVEVRHDPAGCHLIVKDGPLGRYGARRVVRFASFSSSEEALTKADAIEDELLSSGFADLRSRLASFKGSSPAMFF